MGVLEMIVITVSIMVGVIVYFIVNGYLGCPVH